MNANEFIRNQNAIPNEVLLKYRGKFLAWSEDGKTVLAEADTADELYAFMDAHYPLDTLFILSYIPAEWDGTHDRRRIDTPPPESNGAVP